ncbi:transposase, partial [Pilimelia columellifera]|uniref:transposase n=1 Tax=Pilimelia columellifera TaxID=706574 RepID=UPI0031D93C1F
ARTWGPRGVTPILTVAGRGGRRMSVAGMVAYKPGQRARLLYRLMLHRGRKGEPKGFAEAQFAEMIDAAHQQLGGPIVLIWDGLPAHKSRRMRKMIAARHWLRVYQLPAYAPELNPTENVWSNMKRGMANLAAGTITDLARTARKRLKTMQYRPGLINGFLNATGLAPP